MMAGGRCFEGLRSEGFGFDAHELWMTEEIELGPVLERFIENDDRVLPLRRYLVAFRVLLGQYVQPSPKEMGPEDYPYRHLHRLYHVSFRHHPSPILRRSVYVV